MSVLFNDCDLKKAIKTVCSSHDKIDRLKIIISQKENSGLFA